jgi:hypothetical protein
MIYLACSDVMSAAAESVVGRPADRKSLDACGPVGLSMR